MVLRVRELILAAAAIIASSSVASAATVGFTEGERPQVVGTTLIGGDASNHAPGSSLGTLAMGDEIDVYGRIVGAVDYFTLTATANFQVAFILDGYTEIKKNGNQVFVAESGFVAGNANKSNEAEFRLTVTGGPTLASAMFTTPVSLAAGYTAPMIIFSGAPGTYYFSIDGGANDGPSAAARYDISFTATPLPASLPIFVTGIGLGAGMLGWRRKWKAKRAA